MRISRNPDGTFQLPVELSGAVVPVMKKPIVVHAVQAPVDFTIETLEGEEHASAGDWIMIGIEGEMYPIRREIFEKTYDLV